MYALFFMTALAVGNTPVVFGEYETKARCEEVGQELREVAKELGSDAIGICVPIR
tara:strand:+ start:571 stop:735 length:165 start_codon:yes stop_codon:yes gene_type:complete